MCLDYMYACDVTEQALGASAGAGGWAAGQRLQLRGRHASCGIQVRSLCRE